MAASLEELLTVMVEREASDLHLGCGSFPHIRLNGNLEPLEQFEMLTPFDTQRLVDSILTESQQRRFEEESELDLSFGVQGLARFRCNIARQRGSVTAAIRVIPYSVRAFQELQLPAIVERLAERQRGLVLVTGATGSGKSTTLAAMIDKLNSERRAHIVTIEDPIEFVHQNKRSVIHQREVSSDTHSFQHALKSILRQDPDVVMVGELRDLETISAAMTIAETGHLTLASLHTSSCVQTIDRIIDVFPTVQQPQVRAQLSLVLEGVLAQCLVPETDGKGRAMAMEVMIPTPGIRNLIREQKTHQIYAMLQSGGKFGMQTMSQSLAELVRTGRVSADSALAMAPVPDDLALLLGSAAPGASGPRR
jgi:twitching motility protein PilT